MTKGEWQIQFICVAAAAMFGLARRSSPARRRSQVQGRCVGCAVSPRSSRYTPDVMQAETPQTGTGGRKNVRKI